MAKRSSKWFDLSILVLGILLAFASLFVGSGDAIWSRLSVPVEQRASFTYALSIAFLMTGFLIAAFQQVERLQASINSQSANFTLELSRRLDSTPTVRLLTSDQAFIELRELLPGVRRIWNTRITNDAVENPYPTAQSVAFGKALGSALDKSQPPIYREVLSQTWAAHTLDATKTKKRTGEHPTAEYSVIEHSPASFINFIVLESSDGRRQVFCGWAISRNRGFEQDCLHLNDSRAANFFIAWHHDLFVSGRPIKGTS